MALRNFCMDGASSFASGTVVAQMIDPSYSAVIVVVFVQPQLHICRLFVCIQSTSHRRENFTIKVMLVPRDESA